ncbi:asparagine synthase-related protein [Pseudochryseolinea flava]|uniref:asparagine synthase (glutamine-hydrolyzing) n=1 Tax=Pseudochryseolinea flava TaxID=2059302 RepID=A0A364Y5I5_9BACT|nr:asparagine synthase-related protein [Pseudochryseolinea flava]RAW01621.1 hypothetical protein DQQ10_08165 [Pseudochryseolinea flava]
MPGFVAICTSRKETSRQGVDQALASTIFSSKTSSQKLHDDAQLVIHKSFFDFMEIPKPSVTLSGVSAWIDGEIFNDHNFVERDSDFLSTLISNYERGTLSQYLAKVDGVFIVVLYDSVKEILLVITDRFGLKPSYISQQNGALMLAADLKCFTYLKHFSMKFRKELIDCFIQLEHLIGSVTWFEGVDLLKPASIYQYDIKNDRLSSAAYWTWGAIQYNSNISLDDAADQMAVLLERAIQSRSKTTSPKVQLGVSLSGGLDSRAIMASIHGKRPRAYTFGLPDSEDVIVAKLVSAKANVEHHYYDIRTDHWLERRFPSVWRTDGMENMYHFHFSHIIERIADVIDVNVNGFLGDAVFGGSYLGKKRKRFLDTRVTPEIARYYYGAHAQYADANDPYFDIQKTDPYLVYNRGRRFVNMGTEDNAKYIPQRLPFFENTIIEFAYSLPDAYRANSFVYSKALVRAYGDYFTTIRNASSGVPLSNDNVLKYTLIKKFNKVRDMVRYKLGMPVSYTDVYNWIKAPASSKVILSLLDPKHALYSQFTETNFVDKYVLPHLNRRMNYSKQIMGAITLEIWLQEIMLGKYKTSGLIEKSL